MHTIKLQIQDSIYDHIMFLLKSLNTKELKIMEDSVFHGEDDEVVASEVLIEWDKEYVSNSENFSKYAAIKEQWQEVYAN